MSFLDPHPPQPRMRNVAWTAIVAFLLAVAADVAGFVDLRAHAFAFLMAFFALMSVATAWARAGDRRAANG